MALAWPVLTWRASTQQRVTRLGTRRQWQSRWHTERTRPAAVAALVCVHHGGSASLADDDIPSGTRYFARSFFRLATSSSNFWSFFSSLSIRCRSELAAMRADCIGAYYHSQAAAWSLAAGELIASGVTRSSQAAGSSCVLAASGLALSALPRLPCCWLEVDCWELSALDSGRYHDSACCWSS